MSAFLRRITIYPIKSLDGVAVDEVDVLPTGALANDRRFAITSAGAQFVNGKRTAAVHPIRAEYDIPNMTVLLNGTDEFSLLHERTELAAWFRTTFGVACIVSENPYSGFPDDTTAPGPTVISAPTLREVAAWFPPMTLEESQRRFRANLELDGEGESFAPFWEDRLVGPTGEEVPFAIGDVQFLGVNPCQRCVVPTRDSLTGEPERGFQKTFAERRRAMLPDWAPADRFDHFYRLAVNTRLADGHSPTRLRVGDVVTIGGSHTSPKR